MINSKRSAWLISLMTSLTLACAGPAGATPALLVDADTGAVLYQEQATAPWFPASLTKLLTAYVALKAVKDGKLSLDQPLLVTPRAARMSPSKMGFRPGTIVTLDNALKMLMVKSANDMAVTIAEGVGGSVEGFADQMNATAKAIGMHESHFVNPNGLPDPEQVTSARDMAIVARALYADFPEHRGLFGIGALQLGKMVILTHNGLLGRYPGADGMKTGFTCAAGFNLVASATRGNRRLISVVLGSPTVRERNQRVANLLDAGFAGTETGSAQLDALPATGGAPPDMHEEACSRHPRSSASDEAAENTAATPPNPAKQPSLFEALSPTAQTAGSQPATAATVTLLSTEKPYFEPVRVYIGPAPGWTGPIPGGGHPHPGAAEAATAYAPEKLGDAAAAVTAAAGPSHLSHAKGLHRSASHKPPVRAHGVRATVKPKVKAAAKKVAVAAKKTKGTAAR